MTYRDLPGGTHADKNICRFERKTHVLNCNLQQTNMERGTSVIEFIK